MLESIDLGTLIEGGGSGTLIGIGLWRLGTVAREFVREFKAAREQWRDDQRAMRKHYSTEEKLLRELKEERAQEKAVREAESKLRDELSRALKTQRGTETGPVPVEAHA